MPASDPEIPDHLRELLGIPDPLTIDERAISVASAIRALVRDGYDATDSFSSPMGRLLSHFSSSTIGTPKFAAQARHGAPALREFVTAYAAGKTKGLACDVFRALESLVWLRQPEDVDLIAALAHQPFEPESSDWVRVFQYLDPQHPLMVPLIQALGHPLPPAPIAARLLSTANDAMDRGMISHHPFDCSSGVDCLKLLLAEQSPENVGHAWEAAKALQWLSPENRKPLMVVAAAHPSRDVQVELARALAALGEDAGIQDLIRFCKDPIFSEIAQERLKGLGATHLIPEECSAGAFQAMVEMVHWLSSPMEYGRLPAKISVLASRTMFWPPTGDRRDMWIIQFTYPGSEPSTCRGCVGSTTFSLSGDSLHDRSVDDSFALYCAFEGIPNTDLGSEEGIQAAIRNGARWIAEHNPV